MLRHPHYLEIPWEVHWQPESGKHHRHLWLVIAAVVLLAILLIGVGVTSGRI